MLQDISVLMYSHSDYSDVWDMFIGQIEGFLPEMKKFGFVDKSLNKFPASWKALEYDDTLSYNERFSHCLEQIESKYCILHHEDMPLYAPPHKQKLEDCIQILEQDNSLQYIKLIKGGELRDIPYRGHSNLYIIPHDSTCIFAVQPTIWKTEKLKLIYSQTKVGHIREFEPLSQDVCRRNRIYGAYYYENEPLRGMYHHYSSIYPYIATAIVKGKWNMSEYQEEIRTLANKYNIDISIRGQT